jgi:hypothetical protein
MKIRNIIERRLSEATDDPHVFAKVKWLSGGAPGEAALGYWGPHKSDWHLIIDEVPQVDRDWCWNLSHEQTARFLIDPLVTRDVGRNLYLRLLAKGDREGWLSKVVTNKHDDTMLKWMHEYRDLAQDLLSPNVDVWVSRATWNQLKYRGEGKLHIHARTKKDQASDQGNGCHLQGRPTIFGWYPHARSPASCPRAICRSPVDGPERSDDRL